MEFPLRPARPVDLLSLASSSQAKPRSDLSELLFETSPRVRFLKTLKRGAILLELGAGDGNLEIFRRWLRPERSDIVMFAHSLEKGQNFDRYDQFEIGDFNKVKPAFANRTFDAVMSCHFVEHVDGGVPAVAAWAWERLNPGGRLYIEFPSEYSKLAPTKADYASANIDVICTNFFDDASHLNSTDLSSASDALEQAGYFSEERGYWRNPFIEDELILEGLRNADPFLTTMGIWMRTMFSQYVVGVKPA